MNKQIKQPQINLHAVGVCLDEGEMVQKAGCAIRMDYIDEFNRSSSRIISHPFGSADSQWSNIQAARMALASVLRPFRKTAAVTLSVVPEVVNLILKNTKPDKYADIVVLLRQWTGFFTTFKLIPTPAENILSYSDAKICAETQRATDSGTKITNY